MAQPVMPPPGFDELSAEEKLDYLSALWDRAFPCPDDVPLPQWQIDLIAERNAEFERGEVSTRPWEEFRAELFGDLLASD
jgi:hypothetical protein